MNSIQGQSPGDNSGKPNRIDIREGKGSISLQLTLSNPQRLDHLINSQGVMQSVYSCGPTGIGWQVSFLLGLGIAAHWAILPTCTGCRGTNLDGDYLTFGV